MVIQDLKLNFDSPGNCALTKHMVTWLGRMRSQLSKRCGRASRAAESSFSSVIVRPAPCLWHRPCHGSALAPTLESLTLFPCNSRRSRNPIPKQKTYTTHTTIQSLGGEFLSKCLSFFRRHTVFFLLIFQMFLNICYKLITWATPISASLFTAAVWALPRDWR